VIIMASGFGREILNRPILDSAGDTLGHVADLLINTRTGEVESLLVMISEELDPALLPWPSVDGLLQVPKNEVFELSNVIRLR
jgi:sporulation protein YlmC with PRC-barrel domain